MDSTVLTSKTKKDRPGVFRTPKQPKRVEKGGHHNILREAEVECEEEKEIESGR